jgi:uncharacterized protein YuzE
MVELKNALIMGNIYDPDTDCQYVLMRVPAKEWDEYQQEIIDMELGEE